MKPATSAGRFNSQEDTESAGRDGRAPQSSASIQSRGSHTDLNASLRRLEGQSYPAYHGIEGSWTFPDFTFVLDRAQSDPFAQPSRCRVMVRPGSCCAMLHEAFLSSIALREPVVLKAQHDLFIGCSIVCNAVNFCLPGGTGVRQAAVQMR